jgi:hypothetical protein
LSSASGAYSGTTGSLTGSFTFSPSVFCSSYSSLVGSIDLFSDGGLVSFCSDGELAGATSSAGFTTSLLPAGSSTVFGCPDTSFVSSFCCVGAASLTGEVASLAGEVVVLVPSDVTLLSSATGSVAGASSFGTYAFASLSLAALSFMYACSLEETVDPVVSTAFASPAAVVASGYVTVVFGTSAAGSVAGLSAEFLPRYFPSLWATLGLSAAAPSDTLGSSLTLSYWAGVLFDASMIIQKD